MLPRLDRLEQSELEALPVVDGVQGGVVHGERLSRVVPHSPAQEGDVEVSVDHGQVLGLIRGQLDFSGEGRGGAEDEHWHSSDWT